MYSAFVFIFMSFSKTNLKAFNLMLLHAYVTSARCGICSWHLEASGNRV